MASRGQQAKRLAKELPEWLDAAAVANVFGIDPSEVFRLVRRGVLPSSEPRAEAPDRVWWPRDVVLEAFKQYSPPAKSPPRTLLFDGRELVGSYR